MKYLSLFEEFKIKKSKRIHKHFGHMDKTGSTVVAKKIEGEDYENSKLDLLGDVMKSLTKRFKLKSNVKYIDSGSFGMAFVSGNKVIKLTSSKSEANVAYKLIGKKTPHCVHYYDIVFIERYGIYAILMDKAEHLTKMEIDIVEILLDFGSSIAWKPAKDMFKDLKVMIKQKSIPNGDYGLSKDSRSRFKSVLKVPDGKLKKIFNDYVDMYKALLANNISISDLHGANIGYLDGKMVHYDIMDRSNGRDIKKISNIRIK